MHVSYSCTVKDLHDQPQRPEAGLWSLEGETLKESRWFVFVLSSPSLPLPLCVPVQVWIL